MNAFLLWNKLQGKARTSKFEIHTIPQNKRTPLWFEVRSEGDYIIISKAKQNTPSVSLSISRNISFKDFEFVFGYYDRWLKGESGVRQEVSKKSQNTAYIFALISEANK